MNKWINIESEKDVDKIIEKSRTRPQLIFKDSTSCGISAYAKERLMGGSDLLLTKADFNYLDLLAHRPVSAYITSKFRVTHQSPQILLIMDGRAVYHNSHNAIDAEKIFGKIDVQ